MAKRKTKQGKKEKKERELFPLRPLTKKDREMISDRCPACGKLTLPRLGLMDPPPICFPPGPSPLGPPHETTCSNCGAKVIERRVTTRTWVVDSSPTTSPSK